MTETTFTGKKAALEELRARMRDQLSKLMPEFEIDQKAELAYEINQLKSTQNAVILGHNYMEPALYTTVPDYTGDSLELARRSTQTDADIILFCGVKFMAETAKILNPEKTVLIPSLKAGCSLAEAITAEEVRELKVQFPGVPVVTYVNTYADVKAESDYCCTSGNADKVVRHLMAEGHERIIFLPDEYLGRNTADEVGLPFVLPSPSGKPHETEPDVSGPALIGWQGRCEVHDKFSVEDVRAIRRQFPDVAVVAHPECSPEVVAETDYTGSTKQMIAYVKDVDAPHYLLLTECTMGDNIAAENPEKEMLRLCSVRCPHMNEITLEDTLEGLRKVQYQIELPQDVIKRARLPIDRMLEIV